jgi:microcystin degradation protein MlrC
MSRCERDEEEKGSKTFQTHVNPLRVAVFDDVRVGNAAELKVPDGEIEVASVRNQRNDLEVLARKDLDPEPTEM